MESKARALILDDNMSNTCSHPLAVKCSFVYLRAFLKVGEQDERCRQTHLRDALISGPSSRQVKTSL